MCLFVQDAEELVDLGIKLPSSLGDILERSEVLRLSIYFYTPQMSIFKSRATSINCGYLGGYEVGVAKISIAKISVTKISVAKICVAKFGVAKVSPAKSGIAEVSPVKSGVAEISVA